MKLEQIGNRKSASQNNICNRNKITAKKDIKLKQIYLRTSLDLPREDRINVKVLETHDKWFGVTYAEDKEYVQNAFKQLIEDGVYPEKLWK